MSDPIVLDASAFRDRSFHRWLLDYHGVKKIPAIAYCEILVYQVHIRGSSVERVNELLRRLAIEIEWFLPKHAAIAAQTGWDGKQFTMHARDHMIGAHAATPPHRMITYNKEDFVFLGNRVLTPQEAMDQL